MPGNVISNRVSYILAEAAKQACDGAVQAFVTYLIPTLISLTDDERRSLPRLSAKDDVMVAKALAYAITNPELLPIFIPVDEFKRDVNAVAILTPYRQVLAQVLKMIDDTIAQARREAYAAGRAFYQSAKTGADLNLPGAATIRDDLAVCFAAQGKRKTVTTPPPAPTPAPPSPPPAVDG